MVVVRQVAAGDFLSRTGPQQRNLPTTPDGLGAAWPVAWSWFGVCTYGRVVAGCSSHVVRVRPLNAGLAGWLSTGLCCLSKSHSGWGCA